MHWLHLLLLLCSLLFGTVARVYRPVCNPGNYSLSPAMPLPVLPVQFSTLVEGNIAELNSTFLVAEHYDSVGNRGKFESVDPATGQKEVAIYDYDLGEVFLIPDLMQGIPCGVQLINNRSEFVTRLLEITYVNSSVHIGAVTNLFQLDAPSVYLGTEAVRGIPCNHWQTCHVLQYSSYTLDYYFATTSNWNYVFAGEAIPVRISLSGCQMTSDGTVEKLSHVYSFVRFHSGPDSVSDSDFRVPTGLPCRGRLAGKPLPQLPPFFSMQLEALEEQQGNGALVVRNWLGWGCGWGWGGGCGGMLKMAGANNSVPRICILTNSDSCVSLSTIIYYIVHFYFNIT